MLVLAYMELFNQHFDSLPFLFLQAMELMVVDALTLANGELSISASIHEPANFWKVC